MTNGTDLSIIKNALSPHITLYRSTGNTHIRAAIGLGKALIKAPEQAKSLGISAPDGGWNAFLASEVGVSERQIYRLKSLADEYGGEKYNLFADAAPIGIGVLYALCQDSNADIRADLEARIEKGETLTQEDVTRSRIIADLRESDPDIAVAIKDGAFTAQQGKTLATHLHGIGDNTIRGLAIEYGIVSTAIIDSLVDLANENPDAFHEIARSGIVYNGLTDDGVPLAEASTTDIQLLKREARAEEFLQWLTDREDHLLDEAAKAASEFVKSLSGKPSTLANYMSSLPSPGRGYSYFAVVYKIKQDVKDAGV